VWRRRENIEHKCHSRWRIDVERVKQIGKTSLAYSVPHESNIQANHHPICYDQLHDSTLIYMIWKQKNDRL
jgi:hypothetical protein